MARSSGTRSSALVFLLCQSCQQKPGELSNTANQTLTPLYMQLVFASHSESRIYFTLDEGNTWDHHDFNPASIDPRTLKFSPKEDNWILAHDPDNERVSLHMF